VRSEKKIKDILIFSIKVIATILLFYYINKYYTKINFSEFPQINNIGLIFFIAIIFGFLQQSLLFLRWKFSVETAGISADKKSLLKSYFIGQFLGTISPARSGDIAKIFYLNAPKRQGAFALILDGAAALLTLFITGLWKIYPQTAETPVLIADKIISVAGISSIAVCLIVFVLSKKLKFNKILLTKLFSTALIQHIVLTIQGAIIFSILLPISFLEASFAVASAYCIMPLIPVIAAIGIRELSFAFLISAFISDPSIKPIVFAVSYILLLCNSVIFMLPGIYLFYKSKK